MDLKNINKYILIGDIEKAYEIILKNIKEESFESDEAFSIFVTNILNDYDNLMKLINENSVWYSDFPLSEIVNKADRDILEKILVTMYVSAIINNDKSNIKKYSKLLKTDYDENKDISENLNKLKKGFDKYAEYLFEFITEKDDNNNSIFLVSDNNVFEKKVKFSTNNEGKVEIYKGKLKEKNIQDFVESIKKSFSIIKEELKLKKNVGISVTLDGFNENDTIEGKSATLSIFMGILNFFSGKKSNKKTAYIADIDLEKRKLDKVESVGLKNKIEKVIESGFDELVVSKKNYMVAHDFKDKINIKVMNEIDPIIKDYEKFIPKQLKQKSNKIYNLIFKLILIILFIAFILLVYNESKKKKISKINKEDLETKKTKDKNKNQSNKNESKKIKKQSVKSNSEELKRKKEVDKRSNIDQNISKNTNKSNKDNLENISKKEIVKKVTKNKGIENLVIKKINNNINVDYNFKVIRKNDKGEWNKLDKKDSSDLKTGDGIQIYVKAKQTCFIYILNIDSEEKVNFLFPWDKKTINENEIEMNIEYVFPKDFEEEFSSFEDNFYWVDNSKGKERIIIIISKERLLDLEKIILDIDNVNIESLKKRYLTKGIVKKTKILDRKVEKNGSIFDKIINMENENIIIKIEEYKQKNMCCKHIF